jgi:predicted RNA-binding Zn-ribbon protein involved in translation (DUF1610 family)
MDWYFLDLVLPNARRRVWGLLDRLDPLWTRLRATPRRTLLLVGLSATLLLAALIVTLSSGSGSDVPSNEFVGFYCPACDHYFELSHRQFKRLWDRHDFQTDPAKHTLTFKCDQCGKLTAQRADRPPAASPPAPRQPG